MGFYGQITNSNKASFTFDKTYPNRSAMENACQNDGVFLGRYVLIEYDDPAIGIYWDHKLQNGNIYADQGLVHQVNAVLNRLYQDIPTGVFYVGLANGKVKAADISAEKTPYAYNYNLDVSIYGRGYDSTAWIKRYDVNSNSYKYSMIAELNTVVPELHVLVDPPQEKAHSPYWDHESTNLDYYLHLAGDYHDTIKKAASKDVSDETVSRLKPQWTYDTIKGTEEYVGSSETVDADIFYNKAGFDSDTRKYVEMDDAINFTKTSGGRRYASDVFNPHDKVNQLDTREWYVRLPSVGNAICQVWDKMYGESRNKTLASSRGDTKALYDHATIIGIINSVRDLLGYTFAPIGSKTVGSSIQQEDITLYYKADTNGVPETYYYYAYSPTFTKSTSGDYYLENGEYKLANKNVTSESELYTRSDSWVLTELDAPSEDSIYGLIFTIHKIIGTGDADSRDLDTLIGCINRIKDIIDNIDTQLIPNRLMWTSANGVIQTSETQFPSASADSIRVLTGAGDWENRVRSVGVSAGETSETAWTTNTGTIDTHTNNNNNIDFKAGNKWIGLNVNTANQLIQILHTASALDEHNFADDVEIDNDIDGSNNQQDCALTFPVLETDNAGHVIGYSTKTFYIPYNYRNITLATQSAEETSITTSNGTQEADASNDTFTFATGNQWIEAKIEEDKITFAHALINDEATQKWEFKATATDGWQAALTDGNKLTVPTFEIDNAGHIVRNGTVDFYIPHNFRSIIVGASGDDIDATQTNGTLVADSTVDSWTLASQNKWLRVAADPTNDKITIGHSYSTQEARDFDEDVSIATALDGTEQTDNKIVLPVLKTDNAGHVIDHSTNTFYIPHTFKSIVVTTDNDTDTDSTQTNGTLIADHIVDSWTIAPQNKWIDIAADPTNDKITIGHKYSPETTSRNDTGDTVAQTPSFGATFRVPNYETDRAGHIIKSSSHTVQIPQNSYTETENKTAGVMTTMSLDKTSGAFTATRANVGTLTLTEYNYDASNTAKVVATDSVNTAFSKVDAQIAKEITDRSESIADLNNNITDMNERLVASDNTLRTDLTTEIADREEGDKTTLAAAKDYTDEQVAALVDSAPDTLNTLKELSTALGGDENFATTVATNIGANTTAIEAEKSKIDSHIANKENPHEVTANQVIELEDFIYDRKSTMFTNPVFTGIPEAPTADVTTNTDQIATTAFVQNVVANAVDELEEADTQLNASIEAEATARDEAIALAVQNAFTDLMANYGITLNEPEFTIETVENESSVTATVTLSKYMDDTHEVIWYKNQLDSEPIAVTAPMSGTEITEDGEYICVVTRTHNTHTSSAQKTISITVPVPPVEEPDPSEEQEPTV